jgi:ribosome maturation factor RimP
MKGGSGLARKVTKEAAHSNSDGREIGVKENVTVGKEKNFNTLNQRFSKSLMEKETK